MKTKEVIKILETAGFVWRASSKKSGGSHRLYTHTDGRTTSVTFHGGNKDVKKGTLAAIRRQSGLEEIR